MKVLSKAGVYGLRALLYIASLKERQEFVSIGEMSEQLDISFHFLTKILQTLTQRHLLISYRGPNGGISLARPPEDILLIEVVLALEGEDFFDKCLLGLPGCGEAVPCPMHDFWKEYKHTMKQKFEHTSLAAMGERIQTEGLRLTP